MRLFAEQGYEATTVAEIARAADVSTRSVSMYFPTKFDIATASSDAAAKRLTAALHEASESASPVDVFADWLENDSSYVDDEEWQLRAGMIHANPVLSSSGTASLTALMDAATAAVARDLNVSSEDAAVQIALSVFGSMIAQYQLLPGATKMDAPTLAKIRAALEGAFDGLRRNAEAHAAE